MNQEGNKTSTVLTLLVAFYILWQIPIVALYSNTYIVMGVLVGLTLLLFIKLDLLSHFPMLFVAVFCYSLMMAATYATSNVNLLNNAWLVFLEIFPIFIGYIFVHNRMNMIITTAVRVIIIAYVVTAVTTYIGLQKYPGASRLLATDGVDYAQYYKANIGGFSFIYTLVLIHPMCVCLLQQQKKWFLSIIFSVIVGMCVFASAYTIATVLFIGSWVAYLSSVYMSSKTKKTSIGRYILIIVLVALLIFLPQVLRSIASWNMFEEMEVKIQDIANMLEGVEADNQSTEARRSAYLQSLETFIKYPLFGGRLAGAKNGGHSFILDTLANWGLLGAAIMVFLYSQLIKFSLQVVSKGQGKKIVILTTLMSIIVSFLNTGSWTFVLGFVVPVFVYKYNKNEQRMHMDLPNKEGENPT